MRPAEADGQRALDGRIGRQGECQALRGHLTVAVEQAQQHFGLCGGVAAVREGNEGTDGGVVLADTVLYEAYAG